MQKLKKKNPLKELTTEFEVRDALGGEVTGNFKIQAKKLLTMGYWCQETTYDQAHQNTVQP